MTESRRALPALIAFLVLGLAAAVGWGLFRPVPAVLIESLSPWWKLRSAMLLFIRFFPALFTSGILTGYAIAFSPRKGGNQSFTPRWSAEHIAQLRGAFIICIAALSIYVILAEGVKPLMNRFQAADLAKSENFREYLRLAESDIAAGAFADAIPRTERALRIRKEDPEALRLREAARRGLAERGEMLPALVSSADRTEEPAYNPENLTIHSALSRSKESIAREDWYTAHYYAMLAWRLAPGTDPLKQDALRLASEAWNHITEGTTAANPAEAVLFDVKRSGYESIQNGDYLNAYYILHSLRERETAADPAKTDPDVDRLLEIATRGLLDTRFFVDETFDLAAFESERNIFFTNRRTDGGRDAIFIRGIAYSRSNGHDLAYLRGFEYASFGSDGSLLYQYVTPYAKLFPWRDTDGVIRPEILLRAEDRSRKDSGTGPAVIDGELPERESAVLVLDMPYADFSPATLANRGFDSMDLADLMGFADKAERYGFSRESFMREIIMRLSEPFIVLIVAMFMLTLGWKYRLEKNSFFKAWWVLPLPMLPVILEGILESVRYFTTLFVVVFVGAAPSASIFLSLLLLVAGFIATTVFFFSQRSE